MSLVKVVASVPEDEVGPNLLEPLEDVLDRTADMREDAVTELVHPNIRHACIREKRLYARPCVGGPICGAASTTQFTARLGQARQRPHAADLDARRSKTGRPCPRT